MAEEQESVITQEQESVIVDASIFEQAPSHPLAVVKSEPAKEEIAAGMINENQLI